MAERKSCLKKDGESAVGAQQQPAAAKMVAFHTVALAEFPVALGDNPAVSAGVPVQLDWESQTETVYDVDFYEYMRPEEKRRNKKELSLSVMERAKMLMVAGYSLNDIADATMEADKIKILRLTSLQEGQKRRQTWSSFSVVMQSTSRALRLAAKPSTLWAKSA